VTNELEDSDTTSEPAPGDMIAEVAAIAALAGSIGATVLAPPFLLFRALAGRRRSRLAGALRRPGDTRP
jgi:hypothetical protein